MGRLALRGLALATVVALLGVGSYAIAGDGTKNFKARELVGYNESPAISTVANGSFEGRLSKDGTSLAYELSYSGLEAPVTMAHIHFGNPAEIGGISIWLCETTLQPDPNAAADTPTCPQSGTITGEAVASDVAGPNGQGIAPGEFAEILAAMRAGHAYVNVHSTKFPGGEIRAQLNDRGGEGDDD